LVVVKLLSAFSVALTRPRLSKIVVVKWDNASSVATTRPLLSKIVVLKLLRASSVAATRPTLLKTVGRLTRHGSAAVNIHNSPLQRLNARLG
jgi:hypothetical protein